MKKAILPIVFCVILVFSFYYLSQMPESNQENNLPEEGEVLVEEEQENNSGDKNEVEELQIEVLRGGEGQEAKNDNEVEVHYTGWLEDGTKFDSSVDRGTPFTFILGAGQVIKGWDQGVLGMKIGEKRKLTIPSELGYGAAGRGDLIPPNAVLIFEVELLAIK
jgi:FKBP-type peptidyl-prolyl cis-trans isomerase FkpA